MANMTNTSSNSDVLSKARGFYKSLSSSEKKVADFILGHYKETIRMTLADVAQESGVSDATVLRFCRSIGYRSWLEFKIDLTQSLPNLPEQILDEVVEGDSVGTIVKKVFNCSIQALNDTISVMDETSFKHAIDLINNAERILVVGVGTSGPMANEMHNRLLRLGLNCHVQTDSYNQVMESALLTSKDLVITISQTGESEDPLRTTALAKSKGCSVIVITGNSASKLTDYADVVLLSVSHETRVETIASRIAQYAIIHALYVGLAMQDILNAVNNEKIIWEAMMNLPSFQNSKQ
ncbi:MurR/RpiR family transcriptional regulator [Patescibacteria group bacterium]|nr:MurR/RpiR family transcriptional regulator [Patescibacteria group bacterium]